MPGPELGGLGGGFAGPTGVRATRLVIGEDEAVALAVRQWRLAHRHNVSVAVGRHAEEGVRNPPAVTFGLGMTLQLVPSQCSISVWPVASELLTGTVASPTA